MTQLIDYSYARPSPGSIKGAGYAGVIRYLSPTSGKNLGAAERDGLHAAGLSIALVWESDGVTTGGPGVGASHARTANAQADALGYPRDCPIFYATDHDYTAAAVAGYYQGVASAGGRPWGIYGGIKVIDGIAAPYYWQTGAWSGGRVSARAHLYQRIGGATISGTDVNDVRRSFPMWSTISVGSHAGAPVPVNIPAPTPASQPTPTSTPAKPALPTVQEDEMRIISQPERGMWLMGAGFAHNFTAEEWAQFQQYPHGLTVTYIPAGPVGQRVFDLHRLAYTQRSA